MKERPILFSGAMVRAILEGRKTVTRRPVKGFQIPTEDPSQGETRHRWSAVGQRHARYGFCVFGETEDECAMELGEFGSCPYGRPGDRLWVREAWAQINVAQAPSESWVVYRECDNRTDYGGPWKPSIHMRRRDSRILLEITAVRVERLHGLTEEQAEREGANPILTAGLQPDELALLDLPLIDQKNPYRTGFAALWESINGAGSWAASPWVWVIEFKRVTP